jgi:hypothetical protein
MQVVLALKHTRKVENNSSVSFFRIISTCEQREELSCGCAKNAKNTIAMVEGSKTRNMWDADSCGITVVIGTVL